MGIFNFDDGIMITAENYNLLGWMFWGQHFQSRTLKLKSKFLQDNIHSHSEKITIVYFPKIAFKDTKLVQWPAAS